VKYAQITFTDGDEPGHARIMLLIGDDSLPRDTEVPFDPASGSHIMAGFFHKNLSAMMLVADQMKQTGLLEAFVGTPAADSTHVQTDDAQLSLDGGGGTAQEN
jgi:hypothetical protein